MNARFHCGLIYMDKWKSSLNFTKKCPCIFGASHHLMWLLDLCVYSGGFDEIDVCWIDNSVVRLTDLDYSCEELSRIEKTHVRWISFNWKIGKPVLWLRVECTELLRRENGYLFCVVIKYTGSNDFCQRYIWWRTLIYIGRLFWIDLHEDQMWRWDLCRRRLSEFDNF